MIHPANAAGDLGCLGDRASFSEALHGSGFHQIDRCRSPMTHHEVGRHGHQPLRDPLDLPMLTMTHRLYVRLKGQGPWS